MVISFILGRFPRDIVLLIYLYVLGINNVITTPTSTHQEYTSHPIYTRYLVPSLHDSC